MNVRRGDGLLLLSAALATLGGVATAALGWRAGLIIVSLALAGGLVGLARVSVLVFRRLDELTSASVATRRLAKRSATQTERVVKSVGRVERRTDATRELHRRTHAIVADTSAKVDELRRTAKADGHRFRTSLDCLPSDTVRLTRVLDRIMPATTDIPGLGDWAVTPGTVLRVIDDLDRRSGPLTIVECGSGSSTLLWALTLVERGQGGRVIALESNPVFGEETRARLKRHGVDQLATVVDAPLVEQVVPSGTEHLWFDLAGLPDTGPIDVLFVDGPVGGSSPVARYPAVPVFGSRLAPGALVILDDTNRPEEQEILRRWLDEDHGARLQVEATNVRSTFLRSRPSS